jgi:hypothetical protein
MDSRSIKNTFCVSSNTIYNEVNDLRFHGDVFCNDAYVPDEQVYVDLRVH